VENMGNIPLNLTLSAQNCNSLNVTSNISNWEIKVKALRSLNSDLIFLSDTRLKSKDGLDIKKSLKTALYNGTSRKYKLWENSNKSKRGVVILIAADLECEILDAMEDEDQNILMLKVKVQKNILVLASIYGPNGNCGRFYERLDFFLQSLWDTTCSGIIIGGDWNTVIDADPDPESNLDVYLMRDIPNLSMNKKLGELMAKWILTDPYRIQNPDPGGYSYAPFGTMRKNRSRLDFFIVSTSLLNNIINANIRPGRLCKLFDHSTIDIALGIRGNKVTGKSRYIKSCMYGDSAFCLSVKLGAVFFLIKELCKKEPNNATFLG
jgi:exonuclease III